MSEHRASIRWKRGGEDVTIESYSRDHTWSFPGGITVGASAAPDFRGNPDLVDPESAFVASLSSCHMLTFLAVAAMKGFVVEAYTDDAVGELARNAEKRLAMTKVTLRPSIVFGGARQPSEEELHGLHEKAHQQCFIANSVKTTVVVEQEEVARAA